MEPGMEIREEHKREEEQREIHRQALQKHRSERTRKKGKNRGIPVAVLFFTILIAAVLLTVLVMRLREEKEKRAMTEAVLAELQREEEEHPRVYSQEMVDGMIADAVEDAEQEAERRVREDLRMRLEQPGAGLTTVLRGFYPEYVMYQIPGGYRFTPVDDSYPKNVLVREQLQKDENGWYCYVADGEVRSVPMIDVSQFQGEIDWQAVADAGIRHAMLRVGYRGYGSGKLMVDECFEANAKGATEAGIQIGVYFFTQAVSEQEAHEEADLVIEQLADCDIRLPVAIDVERITNDTARADALDKVARTACVRAFLEDIRAAGYTPMIYGGVYTFFEMLEVSEIKEYPVWYAFYDDYVYYPYAVQGWQYTEKAGVPGISGSVDMNLWLPEQGD